MPELKTSPSKPIGIAIWGNNSIQETVRNVQLAEAAGFDCVWVVDSQMLCRELFTTLAACVAATSKIKLASGVTVPRTRHPSVTAAAFATLNELAPGRIVAGFGSGNSSLTLIGQAAAKIAEVELYLKQLRGLMNADEVSLEEGFEARLSWLPASVDVPIYLSASGPKMTKVAAQYTDGVIQIQGITPKILARSDAPINEGAGEAGKDPASIRRISWPLVGIGETPSQGRDRIRTRVAGVLKVTDSSLFEGEDRVAVDALKANYDYWEHASSTSEHSTLVPDRLVDQYAVAGTIEEVREGLKALLDNPRVDEIVLGPQIAGEGAMPIPDVIRSIGDNVFSKL